MIRILLVLYVCVVGCQFTFAQTQDISGIINTYTTVTGIDSSGFSQLLEVKNSQGFKMGDHVLLIQMQGAAIEKTDTAKVGEVLDYRGAGNHEFNAVAMVTGNAIKLEQPIGEAYQTEGNLQLVRVPEYYNCTVTDTLKAKEWDGSTGGVLAFFVRGTLTLNAPIDISGTGFRGGYISNNPDGFCYNGSPGFFYPLVGDTLQWHEGGAMKGEGIALLNDDEMAGKGPMANGGGGGNKHNSGGGGGGNYTAGGHGGNEIALCTTTGNGGIGGRAMQYDTSRIFMGGGGGCGDYNDNVGTKGTDGGGIIFIKAGTITGNGNSIRSNGLNQLRYAATMGDGAGGGGAGGSIWLETENFTDSLYLETNGGFGGSQSENAFVACMGPGGGGGAGMIKIKTTEIPEYVKITAEAGYSGKILNKDLPCYGTNYGAEAGTENTNGYLFDQVEELEFGYVTPVFAGQKVEKNQSLILEKIYFQQSKSLLLDSAKIQLDELATFLGQFPSVIIQLAGHTDNVGDPDLNVKLAEKRVTEAKKYLVEEKGIGEDRIATIAYGGSKPITSNAYEWGRKKNRRVELKILEF